MSTASPWSSDLDKFLAMALASSLAGAEDLRSWVEQFKTQRMVAAYGRSIEVAAFCDYLVESGRLTRWQCKMLCEGKFRGFFMEHFKLLEPAGESDEALFFYAEEWNTKNRVTLRIERPKLNNMKVEFEIVES
jgi:hypothetical protein